MTSNRMLPTWFFQDPDVLTLLSHDTRLLLLWLILLADEKGREVAHAQVLGWNLDTSSESIEAALQDLEERNILVLSQVGNHRSYRLTRWHDWHLLRGWCMPSRCPAPSRMETSSSSSTTIHAELA